MTYIRLGPDIHERVAKTAKALGMDLNGLLNLIVRTNLHQYELMAHQARDPKKKDTVQRLLDALGRFSIELVTQADLAERGTGDHLGKAAIQSLIGTMYEFAKTVKDVSKGPSADEPAGLGTTEQPEPAPPRSEEPAQPKEGGRAMTARRNRGEGNIHQLPDGRFKRDVLRRWPG